MDHGAQPSIGSGGGNGAAVGPDRGARCIEDRRRRVAATIGGAAAVLAAPIFLGAVATGGRREPGFDQWSSFVSELGAAGSPAAPVTNAAFAVVGVCLLLFAGGVVAGLPTVPRVGALLVVPGAAFVVLAASPCSSGCPIALVDAGATTGDAIHNAAATAGLLALAAAAMLLADQAPAGFAPRWYRPFSATAGALVGIAGALFGLSVVARWPGGIAVFERLMLLASMAWNTVTGWFLLRRARRSRRDAAW